MGSERFSLPFPPHDYLGPIKEYSRFLPVHPAPLKTEAILALLRKGLDQADIRTKHKPLRVLILVEDASRPTKTGPLLRLLLDELQLRLPKGSSVTLLVAGGAHCNLNNSWKLPPGSKQVIIHHPQAAKPAGQINGIPLWLNPEVLQADLRIVVGTVNLHFKAGFSGGSKIFLPGASGLPTIFAFHELQNGKLGHFDTPLRQMADQVLQEFPVNFSLQCLSNINGEITGLHCGLLSTAWQEAARALLPRVSYQLTAKYRVCLADARPFDQNFLGIFKTLAPVLSVLEPGGTGIIFIQAWDGLGEHLWRLDQQIRQRERIFWETQIGDRKVTVITSAYVPEDLLTEIFPAQIRFCHPNNYQPFDSPMCLLEGAPLLRFS